MRAVVRVSQVYDVTGVGTVLVGVVGEGELVRGLVADIDKHEVKVRSILIDHEAVQKGLPGQFVSIAVVGADEDELQSAVHTKVIFEEREAKKKRNWVDRLINRE